MNRGYIKLWRKSFDSGLHHDKNAWLLWIYILCHVTYKEIDIHINGKTEHLMPGQMLTGLKVLVKETGLSYQSTRTCLEKLKKYKNLTIKSTNKYSIISVVNWSIYQQDENQINTKSNKQLTNKQQTTNNKQEYKEEKNIKNTTYNNDFEQFWAAYPKKVGKGAAYNSWKKINPSNGTFALIINAVQKQKRCDQWEKDNGQFIPHPQTWLNQSRWEDEPEESRNAKIKPISKEITSENVDDIYAN